MPASSLVRVCLITEPDPFQGVGWLHCAIGIEIPSLLLGREGSFNYLNDLRVTFQPYL